MAPTSATWTAISSASSRWADVGLLELHKPSLEGLPQYVAALERGWSPDNIRGRAAAEEQLLRIADDPVSFIASQDDPEGRGEPITLPDGSNSSGPAVGVSYDGVHR